MTSLSVQSGNSTHNPFTQFSSTPQAPQLPPQSSEPQFLPIQLGVQTSPTIQAPSLQIVPEGHEEPPLQIVP